MEEYFHISPQGLKELAANFDPTEPMKNVNWTTNYHLELPIRMKRSGPGSEDPQTIQQVFRNYCSKFSSNPALTSKKNGIWTSISYLQYYSDVIQFAQALIAYGISEMNAINIIGFNAPQWNIAFYGSIFAHNLPVGVYATNNAEACFYVAEHSECELVVVENKEQLNKYLSIWHRLPKLKGIVIYNDAQFQINTLPEQRRNSVFHWDDFVKLSKQLPNQNELDRRIESCKPGNCCTLIYTSGTTGNPKGVMLSHDNYIFSLSQQLKVRVADGQQRLISYLPLSHVAAQLTDILGPILWGAQLYFAQPDALTGSLIETLKEVRPTFFFSVPRVWEKIHEKMMEIAKSNGAIKTKIATWAKSMGKDGTFAITHGQKPPLCFGLAQKAIFNNVKKALGLDQAKYLLFGAAPLNPIIREYFLSLNMYLINAYGMSECAGVQTLGDPEYFNSFDEFFMQSTGTSIPGTDIKIDKPDAEGVGEICYRGRHVFMGYFKDDESTRNAIDNQRFLHSGDVGKLDKNGNLIITGRIKELIITGGGENIAPVLIENEIKNEIKSVANCMVIGDKRKYLATLLTFKYKTNKEGQLTNEFTLEVIEELRKIGSKANNFQEAQNDPLVQQYIQYGIDQANKKAISRAHNIRKWCLIPGDFSVENGELTPTLKLKRRIVEKKWAQEIENMFQEAKL